jgi:hypothetical protein
VSCLPANLCVCLFFQRRERSVIVTLNPNKFAEKKQRRLDIGGLQSFEPYVMLQYQTCSASPFSVPRLIYDIATKSDTSRFSSYPPGIKAFLYYFMPPEKPRIAAEIRFRITSSDDPASFESGSDLLISNGQPWSRPLYMLSKCYIRLYDNLREDGLVPDDLDAALSTLPSISPSYRRSQLLSTLNDSFTIDFSIQEPYFYIITEQGVGRLRFARPFAEDRITRRVPYTGAYTNDHLSMLLD